MAITRRAGRAAEDSSEATDATSAVDDVRAASPAPSEAEAAPAPPAPKKGGDFVVRGVVGLIMSAALVLVILGGHMWVSIAVVLMEVGMFHEILGMGYQSVAMGGRIPLWRTTGWYFFFSCLFLFYGKLVLAHFEDQGQPFMVHPAWQYALRHHTFLSFVLYCAGCVGFVLSLRPGQYGSQFSYFGRALAALVVVVVQSHFMILNVRQGLVWFLLPSALVITNDSFAYFVGRAFGRHSLTSLSPKKTWEGYVGAGLCTIVAAYFLSGWLVNYPSVVCPRYDFTDCVWYCPAFTCDLPSVFTEHTTNVELLPDVLSPLTVTYRPIQLHGMALGVFASVIAPFGGFLASGAKRAFGLKDFGNLFPGHGGVTDRVDCQLLMAVFTYVYVINFVQVSFSGSPDVGKIMSFVSELSHAEQIELLRELTHRIAMRAPPAAEALLEQAVTGP